MSASTTPNNLTNEQEIIVRDFYEQIVLNESLWAEHTAGRKTVGGLVIDLLGYVSASGQLVPKGATVTRSYFAAPGNNEYDGLYERDGALVRGAQDEVPSDSDGSDEADTGIEAESDSVGDVLLEDV